MSNMMSPYACAGFVGYTIVASTWRPMSDSSAAHRILRLIEALERGQPVPACDAAPLAEGFKAHLYDGVPVERALGLAGSRGRPNARRALILEERDKALHALADHFGTEIAGPDSEGVWDVFEALEQFAVSWPRYRTAVEIPPRLRGRPEGLAWIILKASGGRVLSRRWIAMLLGGWD